MNQGSEGPPSPAWVPQSEEPARSDRLGTVICGWTVERSLGLGPVSESWLAAREGHRGSEGAVLRVLREPFASDARARAEWVGGSWAANRFYHARVPKVMQDGADEKGVPIVVRGWAKGAPLDHVVRSGAMDSKAVLRLAGQLLDALEMAHAHGIVHGALAPSNVIVTVRGSVRLVDFATTPGAVAERTVGALFRARAKASAFVAPERRTTEQSDVWSVGACLHFALAGVPPDPGEPSLRRMAPEVDPELGAVVDRALALDPRDRYESAYAMLGDIRRVMAGRKPRLLLSAAPLPSLGPGDSLQRPESSSTTRELTIGPGHTPGSAEAMTWRRAANPQVRSSEWRGNLLLFAAIALVVAVATFVLVRERLADGRGPSVRTSPSARPE